MEAGLDLDARTGWPDDIRVLLDAYPREIWWDHDNLGPLARFWLSHHQGFRDAGSQIGEVLARFQAEEVTPEDFAGFLAPALQRFLNALHHHHSIEDHHYFPLFQAADARLAPGFDVLENDHELIHARIGAVAETANALLHALAGADEDRRRRAAEAYAAASGTLLGGLTQHLGDEEDLIVPLILDRTETGLGVA